MTRRGVPAGVGADPSFYDSPARSRGDDVDFSTATRPVPAGWTRTAMDDWLVYRAGGSSMIVDDRGASR